MRLALLATAWASTYFASTFISLGGWSFVLGIIIFSGSLYALALSGIKTWGAITPIGGLFFLIGWAFLILGAFQAKS